MSRNFELLGQLEKSRRTAWETPGAESDLANAADVTPNLGTRTSEVLNKLVQRLFPSSRTPSRLIAFTGAEERVGCTWICVHTAEVLCSQTAGRVCLVDANTGSFGIREHFDVPNGAGFAEAMVQDDPMHTFARRVRSNLFVLPAGDSSAGDTVFSLSRVEARLLELRRQFDYVLLDAPPVTASSRSLGLATLADGVVLVVKAGHTRRPVLRLAIEELETAGVRLLGAVLNQRQYPIPETIYKRL